MNKKIIEDVEAEVERLLLVDIESEEVRWGKYIYLQLEVHERKDNEGSMFDEDDFVLSDAEDTTKESVAGVEFDDQINEALEPEDEALDEIPDESDDSNDEESEGSI
jgi:hypothetical protein